MNISKLLEALSRLVEAHCALVGRGYAKCFDVPKYQNQIDEIASIIKELIQEWNAMKVTKYDLIERHYIRTLNIYSKGEIRQYIKEHIPVEALEHFYGKEE